MTECFLSFPQNTILQVCQQDTEIPMVVENQEVLSPGLVLYVGRYIPSSVIASESFKIN